MATREQLERQISLGHAAKEALGNEAIEAIFGDMRINLIAHLEALSTDDERTLRAIHSQLLAVRKVQHMLASYEQKGRAAAEQLKETSDAGRG